MNKKILRFLTKNTKILKLILIFLTLILIVTSIVSFVDNIVINEIVRSVSIAITITITFSLTVSLTYTVNNIEEVRNIFAEVYIEGSKENVSKSKENVVKWINEIKQKFQIFVDEFDKSKSFRVIEDSKMGVKKRVDEKKYLINEVKTKVDLIDTEMLIIKDKEFKNAVSIIIRDINVAQEELNNLYANNSFNFLRSSHPLSKEMDCLKGAIKTISENITKATDNI